MLLSSVNYFADLGFGVVPLSSFLHVFFTGCNGFLCSRRSVFLYMMSSWCCMLRLKQQLH